MKETSNIEVKEDGLIEKSTGREIFSHIDICRYYQSVRNPLKLLRELQWLSLFLGLTGAIVGSFTFILGIIFHWKGDFFWMTVFSCYCGIFFFLFVYKTTDLGK